MAKRKFSFLADEDEKYEQEYQRELAEEQKLAKKEADIKLANKGKQGVSMISGNASPTVGEKNTYNILHWYEETPMTERNPTKVTWELFKKRRDGKFTTTNIKKTGVSSFTFGEVASQHTYRLEAYLHKPEGGGLIITPKSSKIPKIGKVELHYVDNKKGNAFSFYDTLRAKAHTTHLAGKEVVFTLWEDDVKGSGHDPKNLIVEAKTQRVGSDGLAVAEFQLTKALMKKAMKGEADAKELEFYVTVEYYKGNIHDSENVNVKNPLYWTPGVIPPPLGTKKPERKPTVKAKNSPAEQKPISKREEKNILIPQSKDYLQHDWAEVMGKALKDKERTVFKDYGNSTVGVKAPKKEEKEEKCVCQQYDLIWGNKVSCEFRKKVVEICMDLWPQNYLEMANNLMAVFRWESGGTFKSDAPNQANSGGTGLIQFMPSTASSLLGKEVTIEIVKNYYGKKYNKKTKQKEDWQLKRVKEFADMTEIKQLDYVKKYFEPLKGKKVEFIDFYLQVLFPASSMQEEHIVFASSIEKLTTRTLEPQKVKNLRVNAYNSNSGMDINKDGKIWKSEIKTKVQVYITEGMTNKVTKFECNNKNESKENKETTLGCKADCICNLDKILIVNGFIDNSQIKKHRVDVLEQSKFLDSKKLSGIILHRTVTKTTQATINAFSNKRLGVYYGTHFIVGKDGDITQTAHLDYKTNHAKGWNSKSIGIEVVGMPIDKDGNPTFDAKKIVGWENLTEKQAKSVACLTKALLKYYSLKFEDLHCHEDVASKTKGEGEYVLKAIQSYFK